MAGFEREVMLSRNVNFDTLAAKPHTGIITAQGQLLIGTGYDGSSAGQPAIAAGVITSPNSTINIGYSGGNITLDTGPQAALTIVTDSGNASPSGNQLIIHGAGGTVVTGTGNSITITGGGGGGGLTSLVPQTGTSPVTPNGGNQITLSGAVVAAGTNPIRTDGTGANTLTVEVQKSQAIVSADSTKIGLCNFYSSQFSVDANGFVTLVGGSSPPTLSITPDTFSAPGTSPVNPNGSGSITLTGGQVASGTVGANVIRTKSAAASTATIEIQRSTTASSTDSTKNGVAHYNSNQFTVDSSGFVSSIPPSQTTPGVTNLGITYSAGIFTVCAADGTALSATNPGYVAMESSVSPGLIKSYTITANQTFQDNASGGSTIAGNTFGVSCVAGGSWNEDMPFYLYAVSNSSAGSPETAVNFMICRLPFMTFTQGAGTIGKTGSAVASTQGSMFALGNPTVADYANSSALCIGAFRMRSTTNIADWTVQTLSMGQTSSGTSLKMMADGIGQFHEGSKFWHPPGTMGNLANSMLSQSGACTVPVGSRPVSYNIQRGGIINIQATFTPNVSGSGSNEARYNFPFIPVGGAAGAGGRINNYVASMSVDGNVAYAVFYNSNSTSSLDNSDFLSTRVNRFGCVYNARYI